MKVVNLELKNYRNYKDLHIDFGDKLNIIIGNNAQGKTNILEAIYFLSITKSFLPVNDKNCINNDELFAKINGKLDNNKKLSILVNDNGKIIKINGNEILKHYEYIGNLKVIIFSPDSIRLIKDAPGNRRKFLNIEISQLYEKYINALNEYNQIIKQRNEYLKVIKKGNKNDLYFDIINEKMIELSVIIYDYRIRFIDEINKSIGDIFKEISGFSELSIKYLPSIDVSDFNNIRTNFEKKLDLVYKKEIDYGISLVGPHRDDFSFKLNDNDLLLYGSQGQLKLAILALKLAELNVFYSLSGEYPVLLLDDLFSELDLNKRNKIIKYLNKDIQTIITTTDLNKIDKRIVNKATVFEIENGKLIDSNDINRKVRDKDGRKNN